MFLYEWDLNRYEVMDGQQRLNAIVDFYDNGFALKGLEKWHELNGFRYRELPETLKRGLDRRRLSATVLLVEGGTTEAKQSDVRKMVFERLNTGGLHLKAQELRNCLYAGAFNELLIDVSHLPLFTKIWEIPEYSKNVDKLGNISATLRANKRYRRMEDCEIVLRFFAFRKRSNVRGSVRSMLDRCMQEHLNASVTEITELADAFVSRLKLAYELFGGQVFKYEDENGRWLLSQPLYDGIMVALDRLWPQREQIKAARIRSAAKIQKLLKKKSAFEVIVGRPNTAKAVLKRIDLLVKAIK